MCVFRNTHTSAKVCGHECVYHVASVGFVTTITHAHTHTQQRKTIRDDHVLFKWEESTQPDNITQLLAQVRVRVCVGLDIHI